MSIEVTGSGAASAPTDRAVVVLVARGRDADVSVALDGAARAAKAVVGSASEHGVGARDRATTNTTLNPVWDPEGRGQVIGYEAMQTLRMVVADLPSLGALLSDAVSRTEGAVSIQSVALDVADTSKLVIEARDAAFADALEKAEQLARLAGRQLGKAIQIREGQDQGFRPMPKMRAMAASAPAFETGAQDVTVDLQVTFELL